MQLGAWGLGPGAWGLGHWALGRGPRAWGLGLTVGVNLSEVSIPHRDPDQHPADYTLPENLSHKHPYAFQS